MSEKPKIPDMTPREIREQQKHFKTLGTQVISFLAQMDVVMLGPSTPERGNKIGKLCGDLEMANDIALRFGLGLQRKGVKLTKLPKRAIA